jgi:6,7-dimethyl-8-ribityllumazine synthase
MLQSATPPLPKLTGVASARIAIVRSSYYDELVTSMEDDAKHALMSAGIPEKNILTIGVPGAFEIPLACKHIAPEVNGIIALGIIIQGETHHAEEIARGCTDGVMKVQIEENIPITHEVLFVHSLKQAQERAIGKNNKGGEAAITLMKMIALVKKISHA